MSEQFKRVYLSAVWLLFLTTPLRDIIAQECKAFSVPLFPLYITFLGIFWLLWLGYTFGTIILFFSKMHSNPRLPSNQSECREVRIKCHIWTELELNSAVDSSLLGLINEIMSHHVLNWYSKISANPAFSSEVQSLLQYLARALILRLRHCDVTNLLKLKLIPCLLQHIHTSKLTSGSAGGAGVRHPSLGATARLPAYAAQAVSLLLRHVTPPHAHCSPLMASLLSQTVGNRVIARGVQKLSSPLFLYRLLYRLLDPDGPPVLPRFPSSPSVPLLRPLAAAAPPEEGSLENEELALFVRYLQSLGELPVLQCLLDLREVHEMLDGPKIHKESSVAKLRAIRDTFFLSPDKFSLPLAPASLHSLQLILDTSIDTNDVITQLQDSRVVVELLDQLTVARDRHLCHCFMRSGTFRLHSISRKLKDKSTQVSKLEDRRGRGGSIRILRMNSPLVSKKLAKAATIDVPSSDASVDRDIYRRTISDGAGQEAPVGQRVSRSRSSGIENVIVSEDQMEFDLSRWQLTVPEVTRIKTHKTFHQFCLHAVRRDVTPEMEWSIFRRYSEFEVLDSMLRKFFPNAKIGPVPRKILFISSQELETRRCELEHYLTALVRVPELQQSELVCKFLCDINDDKIFQAENFGDHAGRMMRNIHKSILTDRHEFLSKPLDNFLESTAPPAYRHQSEVVSKVVSSRDKWLEDSREYSKVFDPPTDPPDPPVPLGTPLSISSWGDLLQFVFNSVLTVPYPIRLLSAVLNLLLPYQTELWLQQSADQLIGQLSNESYLVFLIEKVRDTLYHSAPQVYNRDLLKSELVAQKLSLRERILSQIPKVAMHAIGEELLLCNLEVVLECFENQENNQQLVSSLLDQIILELFPELT